MSQLLSALPVGSLVKDTNFTYLGTTPIFRVLEHGHTGDPSGSTALEFRDIICLKAFDAAEPNNTQQERKNNGNNRYVYSNLLQWLNSSGAANSWYSAQHTYDQSPNGKGYSGVVSNNPYASEAGFLSFFPDELKKSLNTASKKTAKSSYDGSGSENVSSRIFLLSTTEVGIDNDSNVAEGSVYSYYVTDGMKRRKKNLMNNAAKGDYDSATSPWYWWLRTPKQYDYYESYQVYSNGDRGSQSDRMGYIGVSPAFCVSSNLTVSDSPDVDGAYTFVWNATPTISPATTNYGNVSTPPAITCTIADADGDSFTYTVKVNGVTQTSGSGTASKTFALDMNTYWASMALGSNTVSVTATDSKSATTTATYTMNKTNSAAPVPTTDLVNNARKDTSFYIGFQIGQDADGDSQTVVAQVSDSSDMSDPTEFTSVEKLVAGAWIPVQTLTNADAGASLRIQVTGQTVGDTIYVRLKDTDSGSGSPVYTSTYAVSIGSTLEFDTLPITRTTKPSIVVAYLDKTMPADATLQMYACNNANDATPTWEPITEGESHQFTNKTKTATNWGISVKTNIAAGATAGEISVSAVGLGVL